jgi:hypothetical protein
MAVVLAQRLVQVRAVLGRRDAQVVGQRLAKVQNAVRQRVRRQGQELWSREWWGGGVVRWPWRARRSAAASARVLSLPPTFHHHRQPNSVVEARKGKLPSKPAAGQKSCQRVPGWRLRHQQPPSDPCRVTCPGPGSPLVAGLRTWSLLIRLGFQPALMQWLVGAARRRGGRAARRVASTVLARREALPSAPRLCLGCASTMCCLVKTDSTC